MVDMKIYNKRVRFLSSDQEILSGFVLNVFFAEKELTSYFLIEIDKKHRERHGRHFVTVKETKVLSEEE